MADQAGTLNAWSVPTVVPAWLTAASVKCHVEPGGSPVTSVDTGTASSPLPASPVAVGLTEP